jgi:hypothetical protein
MCVTGGTSYAAANQLVEKLVGLGVLREMTVQVRHRRFMYDGFIALFDEADDGPVWQISLTGVHLMPARTFIGSKGAGSALRPWPHRQTGQDALKGR